MVLQRLPLQFNVSILNGKSNPKLRQNGPKWLPRRCFPLTGAVFLFCWLRMLIHQHGTLETLLAGGTEGEGFLLHDSLSLQKDLASVCFPADFLSSSRHFSLAERNPRQCKGCSERLIHYLEDPKSTAPNYNGLSISFQVRARRISPDDLVELDEFRAKALDDSEFRKIPHKYHYYEDSEGHRECYQTSWRANLNPVCNVIHEFTLERPLDHFQQEYEISYLGHGAFRDTWRYDREETQISDSFAIKKLRMDEDSDIRYMFQIRKEAIIMERMTASPRFVDIYGHCGTTILLEAMVDRITSLIMPGDGYMRQSKLDGIQEKANDVVPMNNVTAVQKLNWAITAAESLAELHGYRGGVIAHGDVQTDQWLLSSTGALKLNDFNHGEIYKFNPSANEYCEIERCYSGPYSPPEELLCKEVDERFDVYPFGYIIYSLLTGLEPFYSGRGDVKAGMKDKAIQLKPFVDARYRNRSMIEGKLVEVMEQCWEWRYKKRTSIFEVVKMLRGVKEAYQGR